MKTWKTTAMLLVLAGAVACQTSDEEKLTRIVEGQLTKCKAAEGVFFDVEIDDEKSPILREVCELPVTDVKRTDEFHAVAKTGPYLWLFKIHDEHGVWILTEVDYEPMSDALSALNVSDPDEESMKKAVDALGKAEDGLPDNSWIRITRVEQAMKLRDKQRGKDKVDPAGLGDAKAVYEANLAWAKAKSPDAQAKMMLTYIDAYKRYMTKLQDAYDGLGGQDEWLESAIRAAEKEKDTKTVETYTADLEKQRAERPGEQKMLMERKGLAFDAVCAAIAQLPTVSDAEVAKAVDAAKATDCKPESRPKFEEAPPEP
ncbi:MAG: hypothetical protein R3E66_03285 [bacterium]